MSDKSEAPTQTITLDYADRANLKMALPPGGRSRSESRAMNTLESRLNFNGEVQMLQNRDGTYALPDDLEERGEVEYDLTDTEVSIINHGLDQLEERDQFPYSDEWFDLVDRIDELVQNVKNRNNGEED